MKQLKAQDVLDKLPKKCIEDLTSPDEKSEIAEYWVKKLKFSVDRQAAIDYIVMSGAHSREEMEQEKWDDTRLSTWILWSAADSIKHSGLFILGI